jgi:hypothetical protein
VGAENWLVRVIRLSLVAVALLLASSAGAVPVFSDLVTIEQVGAGIIHLDSDQLGCSELSPGSGMYNCSNGETPWSPSNPAYTFSMTWDMTFDVDPFVNLAFGFTNTGATATYILSVILPTGPIGAPTTVMGGSTGGSTTDANFNGLGGVSTVASDPFYTGLIDGSPVVGTALHAHPYSSPAYAFPGDTNSLGDADFGLPGPTTPGPAVTTSIGIRNKFSLTGGDSVASTNFFVVEPVPEPATGLLVTAGVLGLALYRRRRPQA